MNVEILQGNALAVLKTLPDESVDMVMTSPPYWALRDYGVPGQLGLEPRFQDYISNLCDIFDEVKRVLKKEGTCWVNLGDTYSAQRWTSGSGQAINRKNDKDYRGINPEKITGMEDKCLVQIPSRFAIEMVDRGWILRNEIIWHKPNCMPSSAMDRFTIDFEKIFFFTKSKKYFFDSEEVMEDAIWKNDRRADAGRIHYEEGKRKGKDGTGQENFVSIKQKRLKRTVWKISPKAFKGAHFAVYPETLCITPIKAGCPRGGGRIGSIHGLGDHLESCSRPR